MNAIRVLVADDQRLVRDGIASLLALQEGIEVAGTAENGREALIAAKRLHPDLVLMDIRMPVLDGIAAAGRLKEEMPGVKVVMLTTFDDEEYIVKSLKAGAVGYLMKDIPTDELAEAVRLAMRGSGVMAPAVLGTMAHLLDTAAGKAEPAVSPEHKALWDGLSPKEREILKCLARGDTNREIAEEVFLSEGTVKNYISGILTALDMRDRTQAALLAQKNGWVRE